MNKLLLSVGCLLAANQSQVFAEPEPSSSTPSPVLNIDANFKFSTACVSRGRYCMGKNVVPDIRLTFPLFDQKGRFYVAVESTFKVDSSAPGGNDVSPSLGFSYDITDNLTIDFGYVYDHVIEKDTTISSVNGKKFALVSKEGQFMTQNGAIIAQAREARLFRQEVNGVPRVLKHVNAKRSYHEVYAGLKTNFFLKPSIDFKYDFTQKRVNVEGKVGHTFNLGSVSNYNFTIDLGAKIGYVRIKKPNGVDNTTEVVFETLDSKGQHRGIEDHVSNLYAKNSWFYVGANGDLVCALNEHTKARIGVEFICNSGPKDSWINANSGKKHKVW
ncbi:MAG: outer membrane protein transport protein, partial [Puniceicoccales bacterium]|nr:outer membrane protein transport protein [Puniceicoccales bacterium]